MEMMVVLLIVAIIAAASAPMVTKKLSRNAGTGDSPWVFTGLNNYIAYLGDNSGQVLIGAANRPASADHAMLYIAGRNNWEHIAFGNSNNTDSMGITANPGQRSIGINRINNNLAIPQTSVMFGMNQTLHSNNYSGIVAIGDSTVNRGSNSVAVGVSANASSSAIAIGPRANADNTHAIAIGSAADNGEDTTYADTWSIAIGTVAQANDWNAIALGNEALAETRHNFNAGSIAIGHSAQALRDGAIAIGPATVYGTITEATATNSIAIGCGTQASDENSVAIGNGAQTTTTNQIVLGTGNTTVYIPGRLVVAGETWLGNNKNANSRVMLNTYSNNGGGYYEMGELKIEPTTADGWWGYTRRSNNLKPTTNFSDRRLKNVGEKYTAGLAELKKLNFFHYTFKKDENKTPHVGVMAQDLQKVFPDAVTKGEDGYLQIRFEDMFYAVINAVKELDNKITEIVQNITYMRSKIEKQAEINKEQSKTIAEQQKTIEQQQQLIKNLEKRIEKLED